MNIIVDSNIVFSSILNTQNVLGHLLINGSKYFSFFTIGLLKEEILKHKSKILKLSGLNHDQFESSFLTITSRILFIDDIVLSESIIDKALDLVSDIDINDALFVALTIHLNGKLWTGDKKLTSGLKNKGFSKIVSTNELHKIYLIKTGKK